MRTQFSLALTSAFAVLAVLVLASAAHAATAAAPTAFFGFRMINSSLEETTPEEMRRLAMLEDILRSKLKASGRYRIVDIPKEVQAKIAAGPAIGECNGCEVELGKQLGAERILWGTVQKVSNLILNLNVYMGDVSTGQMTFIKSVDIRGNTDESWTTGLNYLIRNYMLAEQK
jgi:uncharacterized protein DUF2380